MGCIIDKSRPICLQLTEKLCVMIAREKVKAHERLLSMREAALLAGVNPNTAQKAFTQLENIGLVYSVSGSGWYVADNIEAAQNLYRSLIWQKTKMFFDLQAIEILSNEAKIYIEEWCK